MAKAYVAKKVGRILNPPEDLKTMEGCIMIQHRIPP